MSLPATGLYIFNICLSPYRHPSSVNMSLMFAHHVVSLLSLIYSYVIFTATCSWYHCTETFSLSDTITLPSSHFFCYYVTDVSSWSGTISLTFAILAVYIHKCTHRCFLCVMIVYFATSSVCSFSSKGLKWKAKKKSTTTSSQVHEGVICSESFRQSCIWMTWLARQ